MNEYVDRMNEIIYEWECYSEAKEIARKAVKLAENAETPTQMVEVMKEAVGSMRQADDYEDTHQWEGDISIMDHYEQYDIAEAMIKYFNSIWSSARIENEEIPF